MDTLHIGRIIKEPQLQDAVHIAIAPVVAYHTLDPGEHVGLTELGEADSYHKNPIGVVDPFLTTTVRKGEKFWLFLYPGSITSLKHFWTHPAFEKKTEVVPVAPIQVTVKEPPVLDAYTIAWRAVESIADNYGLDATELLEAADSFVQYNEYFSQGGRFEGEYLTDDFWPHYEVIRNVVVPNSKQHSFFTCSC